MSTLKSGWFYTPGVHNFKFGSFPIPRCWLATSENGSMGFIRGSVPISFWSTGPHPCIYLSWKKHTRACLKKPRRPRKFGKGQVDSVWRWGSLWWWSRFIEWKTEVCIVETLPLHAKTAATKSCWRVISFYPSSKQEPDHEKYEASC